MKIFGDELRMPRLMTKIEYDLQEVDTFPGITNAMISVPSPTTHGPGPTPPGGPAVAAGGGGVGGPPLQQPAPLTIDCGGGGGGGSGGAGLLRARTGVGSPRRGKKRSESGGSASSGSTPGSWEEAMSQMSRELHVICRSPDNLTRFGTNSPTSPKYLSGYSPPSPKLFTQLTAASTQTPGSVTPPSPSNLPPLDVAAGGAGGGAPAPRPSTPESRPPAQALSVKHLQTEENLRQKLSSIVCRGLPRRSMSVNDGTAPPKVVRPSEPISGVKGREGPQLRKTNGAGFAPQYSELIQVGNRSIEDLRVVIEDRQLKVYADNSKSDETDQAKSSDESSGSKPSETGDDVSSNTNNGQPTTDLIKVVKIPENVSPEKLICIMRDGNLQVRETKSQKQSIPTTEAWQQEGLPGQRASCGGRIPSSSPQEKEECGAEGAEAPESPRHRSKSDGSQPAPSQGPIVIHDDGSLQLKLVLQIPPGYRMQDLVIKTIDDELIVSGKKPGSSSLQPQSPPEGATQEAEATPTPASPTGPQLLTTEFMKVFELPNTVDPYSITAHVTEKCQLVIQARLSSRCRCGSY